MDLRYMGTNADTALGSVISKDVQDAWKNWATACQVNGAPTVVQLCHPGRQSPMGAGDRSLFAKTIAPSPIPLDFGPGLVSSAVRALVFGTPKEMTVQDIKTVIQQFVDASELAYQAGFAGVEIHGAHGYLLTQFLSPVVSQSNSGC